MRADETYWRTTFQTVGGALGAQTPQDPFSASQQSNNIIVNVDNYFEPVRVPVAISSQSR